MSPNNLIKTISVPLKQIVIVVRIQIYVLHGHFKITTKNYQFRLNR